MSEIVYELYYWPVLQGRGEFIRLIFEEAGARYKDVGRLPEEDGGGIKAIVKYYQGEHEGHPAFAPPVLKVGDLVLAQMPNICLFLGRRLGLCPDDEAGSALANQLMLTVTDLVDEVHDTHHPLGPSLYFEDQEDEALQRSQQFLEHRLPRFLSYFQRVLRHNGGEHLMGDRLCYVDLALFQVLTGVQYAFPNAYARLMGETPELERHREAVAARPRVAEYLASPRRLPFNEDGIFRHYGKLDP